MIEPFNICNYNNSGRRNILHITLTAYIWEIFMIELFKRNWNCSFPLWFSYGFGRNDDVRIMLQFSSNTAKIKRTKNIEDKHTETWLNSSPDKRYSRTIVYWNIPSPLDISNQSICSTDTYRNTLSVRLIFSLVQRRETDVNRGTWWWEREEECVEKQWVKQKKSCDRDEKVYDRWSWVDQMCKTEWSEMEGCNGKEVRVQQRSRKEK